MLLQNELNFTNKRLSNPRGWVIGRIGEIRV
jgi:hypothetical protein